MPHERIETWASTVAAVGLVTYSIAPASFMVLYWSVQRELVLSPGAPLFIVSSVFTEVCPVFMCSRERVWVQNPPQNRGGRFGP